MVSIKTAAARALSLCPSVFPRTDLLDLPSEASIR